MNKTQTFEKLDELVNGLRDISGLSDEEQEKTPERKKWRAAIDALPKEEKKEYYERAYEKSREEKIEEDKQKELKLKRLFEKEIRPNTKVIYFWLGEKIIKEEKLLEEKKTIGENWISEKNIESEEVQNIDVPEIVDIDYSDIKNLPVAKNGGVLKPYKDGFLIVRDDNPKNYHVFNISDYTTNPKTKAVAFFHSLTFSVDTYYYLSSADIKNVKDYKNNLSFYFVFKKAYKNKAFKITFKNNKYVNYIFI